MEVPCKKQLAKLFYVPFYGGMDVLRWHFKNVTEHLKDVLSIEVLKWLGSKQSWRKNSGKDHVFVLGKISWDFRRNNKFASLVSVCIPVIFDPYTAYYQYAWHLPEDHRSYSVYINKDDLKAKKVNVIKKLMLVTIRERKDMRSYIVHELLPGLVYGDPNANFERFRDAFDITMDSLLHKISKNL
uniref:Exostosin GT47 domain-containing protein n=1 Tax=Brassica oleracea var. oleracea TaxID=109376 RepID=A0A0D3BVZ3_BRAOL